jgi:hypothetical protein
MLLRLCASALTDVLDAQVVAANLEWHAQRSAAIQPAAALG